MIKKRPCSHSLWSGSFVLFLKGKCAAKQPGSNCFVVFQRGDGCYHDCVAFAVIETMAGQGSTVGGSFEEIRSIIDRVDKKDRIGVCIDTCHIFAAGKFCSF